MTRKLIEELLGQLVCNTTNMEKGMSKSIQKLCARENKDTINAAREYLAQPEQSEPVEQCTESDSWNCKYCRKTETCKALQDPRNFGKPKAPEPLTDEEVFSIAIRCNLRDGHDFHDLQSFAKAILAAQRSKE